MSGWGRWLPSPFGGGGRTQEPEASNGYYTTDYPVEHDRQRGPYQQSDQYIRYPPNNRTSYQESPRSPPRPQRPARDDDILIFRYKSTNYPLKFPPYSVDDRRLTVGYAREKLSEKLNLRDPDLISMIYKGKKLDDDNAFFCDYGFRSDKASEIFCTLTHTAPFNRPAADDASEDDLSDASAASQDHSSSAAPGAKRRNKSRKKKRKNKPSAQPAPPTSSLPYPTGGVEYLPMPAGTLHPSTRGPPSTTPSSQTSSTAPTPQPPATALGKLESIGANFRTTLVPQCVQYMQAPPPDDVKRKFEHKKLTETIMSQVMLKLDAVETEGDNEARMKRKALVREAQDMLDTLDESLGSLKEG